MALSTAGTNLTTNAAATGRRIVAQIFFLWDGATPTDETSRLISCSISSAISMETQGLAAMGQATPATANIVMNNPSGRFSPENSAGPLYSDIQNNKGYGVEVRVDIGYNDTTNGDEMLRRFTGYIDDVQVDSPKAPTARFTAIDVSFKLFEHKSRTALLEDQYPHQIMETILDDANIAGGDQNLDTAMHRIPFAWLESEGAWRQLQQLAEASAGMVWVDSSGNVNYESIYHWLTDTDHSTSVVTIAEDRYTDAKIFYPQQEIYNSVRVPYQPRRPGPAATVFTLNMQWIVPPATTKTFNVRFKQPVIELATLVADDHYIALDGGGNNRNSDVVVTVTQFAQSADVQVQNTNATYAIEFREFRLEGIPLTGGATRYYEVDDPNSSIGDPASALRKQFDAPENPFVQTDEMAEVLAEVLLDRHANPQVAAALTGVKGIPWLERGDRATVDLTAEGVSNIDMFVVQMTETVAPAGVYQMDLTCLNAASFFPYTSGNYFILNTDAPHVSASNRIFY